MKHRLKLFQLWLHRHYGQIRHWLLVILGIILLTFSMVMVINQNQLIKRVEQLAEQNKVLSQQNKELNTTTKQAIDDNQSIAKQNRSYSRCIAEIFAFYTQNQAPVQIVDLDTCTTASQTQATDNSPLGTQETTPAPSPAAQPAPANPQPTPQPNFFDGLVKGINQFIKEVIDGS